MASGSSSRSAARLSDGDQHRAFPAAGVVEIHDPNPVAEPWFGYRLLAGRPLMSAGGDAFDRLTEFVPDLTLDAGRHRHS